MTVVNLPPCTSTTTLIFCYKPYQTPTRRSFWPHVLTLELGIINCPKNLPQNKLQSPHSVARRSASVCGFGNFRLGLGGVGGRRTIRGAASASAVGASAASAAVSAVSVSGGGSFTVLASGNPSSSGCLKEGIDQLQVPYNYKIIFFSNLLPLLSSLPSY